MRFARLLVIGCCALLCLLASACGVRDSAVITGDPAPTVSTDGTPLYFAYRNQLVTVVRRTGHGQGVKYALDQLLRGPNRNDLPKGVRTEIPTRARFTLVRNDPGRLDIALSGAEVPETGIEQIACTALANGSGERTVTVDGHVTTSAASACRSG